jgi:hypothetical protein
MGQQIIARHETRKKKEIAAPAVPLGKKVDKHTQKTI